MMTGMWVIFVVVAGSFVAGTFGHWVYEWVSERGKRKARLQRIHDRYSPNYDPSN